MVAHPSPPRWLETPVPEAAPVLAALLVSKAAVQAALAVVRRAKVETGTVKVGKPRDIYRAPANRFVAEFVGRNNILTGTVKAVRVVKDRQLRNPNLCHQSRTLKAPSSTAPVRD